MKIAVVFSPMRRGFSFTYQLNQLVTGLEEEGVKAKVFDTFTSAVRRYDILLWWTPFRTPEFEDVSIFKKRYTKVQVFYNPVDTNSLSNFVKERVKAFADVIITASTHNKKLYEKTGIPTYVVPHSISPEDLPEDCELDDDLYFVENKTFPIRRGADIAVSYPLKFLSPPGCVASHDFYLKHMCKAGNIIMPARGGEFEIEVLEALAMGMKVYVSRREIFDYVEDMYKVFPINGEYCNTEYGNDIYQQGCYDNVVRVDKLPEVPSPNPKHYVDKYNYREKAKVFLKVLENAGL